MAARDFKTRLARRASKAGLQLPDTLTEQLTAYYELLSRWNRKINLTALDDPDQAIDRLLLEPVIAARQAPGSVRTLMDVGSGGGSPAIPLALSLNVRSLVMVEVKARKSAFLREATRTLDLGAVAEVENARFEEVLGKPSMLEHFDLLSIRAVRVEGRVLNTVQAFVRPGGAVFLFRGPSGPERPEFLPPLEWRSTVTLLDSLQSRLTVAEKTLRISDVPRGTSAGL